MVLNSLNWSSGVPRLLAYTETSAHAGSSNLYVQSTDNSRTYTSGDWRGNVTFVAYTTAADSSPVAQLRNNLPGRFKDDVLVAGLSGIRAVHVTELRARIDAVRIRLGLLPFVWADDPVLTAGATVILGRHITALRAALSEAYATAGWSTAPMFTDPSLTAGVFVNAIHIVEIRGAVMVLE